MLSALLSPLSLILGIVLVLVLDLVQPSPRRSYRLSLLTLCLAFIASVFNLIQTPAPTWSFFEAVLSFDPLAFAFSALALALAFLAVGISWDSFAEEQHSSGEYYCLMLTATLGAVMVAHAEELLTFFVAFELLSIPLYILSGFRRYHRKSAEAGLKYFLSGALSSAFLLFGSSWVYGAAGSTHYDDILAGFSQHYQPLMLGLLMILATFAFKISAAPFHMWAPDTYEGSPIPVAAFISTVPKVVMIGALLRLFLTVAGSMPYELMLVVSALSVLSVAIGNLVAITQREITRMAAYSGVAQIGYVLIGVAATLGASGAQKTELAVESMGALLFYLLVYTVTNLAFWLILLTISRSRGSTDINAFNGLSQTSPALAFGLLICFFSLAGVPPLAGFMGKLYLFRAAFYTQPMMAFFGMLGSVVSLYYYFNVLRHCYFLKPEDDVPPLVLPMSLKGLLFILLALTTVGGLYPGLAQACLSIAERIFVL